MHLSNGYEDRKARIDMTSMMDVMFLILVFFVYSIFSMTVHRGMKVNLPVADGALERRNPIVITLAADNALSLNKRPYASAEEIVYAALAEWRKENSPVLISADRAASLGVGIELLGKLKKVGIEKIAFQVKAKTPEAQPHASAH